MPRASWFISALLLAAVVTTLALFKLIDVVGVGSAWTGIDIAGRLVETAARMRAEESEVTRIGVIGDSTVIAYPGDRSVPNRLEGLLGSGAAGYRVYDFSHVGFGPPEQWAIADIVAGAKPDWVVLGLNLASLSPAWEAAPRRPELVGWIEPRRLPGAATLLSRMGMTFDQIASAVAMVRWGSENVWKTVRHRQIQVEKTRRRLLGRLGGPIERPPAYPFGKSVGSYGETPEGREQLASVLGEQYAAIFDGIEPDRISLALLDETIRVLARSGAQVVVLAVPMNIEVLRIQPFYDEAGLEQTIQSLAQVVESAGGQLVDLHDDFSADGFRDVGGHLTLSPIDGPLRVAESLAQVIQSERSLDSEDRD